MLSPEIIGVLGDLSGRLVYDVARTQPVRREAEAKRKPQYGAPAAAGRAK